MCLAYSSWSSLEHGRYTSQSSSDRHSDSSTSDIKRAPVTVKLMELIINTLDHADPLDEAVTSCFSTIFYSVACTGLPTLNTFDPAWHVKPMDISNQKDHNNLEVTVFHIPKTKCSSEGEDVFWSCVSDPKAALDNHFRINDPPADGPLFAYRHARGIHPLTTSGKPNFYFASLSLT